MLTTARRTWVGFVLFAVVAALLITAPVHEARAAECTEVILPDGTIEIICDDEGDGDDDGGSDDPSGGGIRTCEFEGEEVPCTSNFGAWGGLCYERLDPSPPAPESPAWQGHGNDGWVMIECSPPSCLEGPDPCPDRTFHPSPNPPEAVGPSAAELAQRAVAAMNLAMGQIGSTPPASAGNPNAVGAIGLPIWLWIANGAENTIGPITRTASDGGLSVSATGTLNRVEWTLTDGNGATVGAITCDGANAPGTPYDGRNSAEPSPTCGFGADLNSSPGNLTLTGTAYWAVAWQGGGQSGEIDVPPQSNAAQIRIGELQALVRD